MAEEDLLPKKTMAKAWNQGLNLTSAPIQHVIRIMTFAEEALLHNTTRDYSKDEEAPHPLEHLDGFNPIPQK